MIGYVVGEEKDLQLRLLIDKMDPEVFHGGEKWKSSKSVSHSVMSDSSWHHEL